MKKKLFMLFTLLTMFAATQAADELTVTSAGIPKGAGGVIAVELNNSDNAYAGFQMTITLPEGLTYSDKASGNRFAGHILSLTADANNPQKLYIESYANPTANYTGTSGALFYIYVNAASDISEESLDINISNVVFAQADGETQWKVNDADYPVNITSGVVLDENSTVVPAAQTTAVDVTVRRKMKAGVWNSVSLPFAMSKQNVEDAFGEGTIICEMKSFSISGNSIKVRFEKKSTNTITKNTPVLVKIGSSTDITEFTVNKTIDPEDGKRVSCEDEEGEGYASYFIGTLKKIYVPADNLFINNNDFYYSDANEGLSVMKGFRGYFQLYGFSSSDAAGAKKLILLDVEDEPTSITTIDADTKAFTIDNGKIYSIGGQQLNTPAQKGIYIQNGKKISK